MTACARRSRNMASSTVAPARKNQTFCPRQRAIAARKPELSGSPRSSGLQRTISKSSGRNADTARAVRSCSRCGPGPIRTEPDSTFCFLATIHNRATGAAGIQAVGRKPSAKILAAKSSATRSLPTGTSYTSSTQRPAATSACTRRLRVTRRSGSASEPNGSSDETLPSIANLSARAEHALSASTTRHPPGASRVASSWVKRSRLPKDSLSPSSRIVSNTPSGSRANGPSPIACCGRHRVFPRADQRSSRVHALVKPIGSRRLASCDTSLSFADCRNTHRLDAAFDFNPRARKPSSACNRTRIRQPVSQPEPASPGSPTCLLATRRRTLHTKIRSRPRRSSGPITRAKAVVVKAMSGTTTPARTSP